MTKQIKRVVSHSNLDGLMLNSIACFYLYLYSSKKKNLKFPLMTSSCNKLENRKKETEKIVTPFIKFVLTVDLI